MCILNKLEKISHIITELVLVWGYLKRLLALHDSPPYFEGNSSKHLLQLDPARNILKYCSFHAIDYSYFRLSR